MISSRDDNRKGSRGGRSTRVECVLEVKYPGENGPSGYIKYFSEGQWSEKHYGAAKSIKVGCNLRVLLEGESSRTRQ